jgi:hypothetical protein
MIDAPTSTFREVRQTSNGSTPTHFLNCFEILNLGDFEQTVNLYAVDFLDATQNTQENRGELKNVIWGLRKQHRSSCPGYGFVIDISPRLVVVPATWKLPCPIETSQFRVTLDRTVLATSTNAQGRNILAGILRESIKKHFKEDVSSDLGSLWQDYDSFCQTPDSVSGEDYLMCRRFGFAIKALAGGRTVLLSQVGTATVDSRSFKDYYRSGDLTPLAEMVEAKLGARLNRRNRPVSVRVLQQCSGDSTAYRALDLEDVDVILQDSGSPSASMERRTLRCRPYGGSVIDVELSDLRLILDTQITLEDHAETIIEPADRLAWAERIRNFVDGLEIGGKCLRISTTPLDAEIFDFGLALPPAVRVRGANGNEMTVESPRQGDEHSLRKRARLRSEKIRQNGFLIQRPIDPLLAWPRHLGDQRARRMKADVESIWKSQGLDADFSIAMYSDVNDIATAIERGNYNAVLAVLPEGSRVPFGPNTMHERIKQRIQLPSQCIQHDHTLPARWAGRTFEDFQREDGKRARRILQAYQLCLDNLLVKHHCFPFAPQEPFHYNTHVGLDVGGVHNTHAMACIGHGFRRPLNHIFFRPEAIPIEVQKKEPIPTDCLYRGLLNLFELVHSRAREAGVDPDFETTIFYRDGQLLGDGDSWNEKDALSQVHQELLRRNWITRSSIWTAVEVLKSAEGWRLFRSSGGVANPLVGEYLFPFEEPNIGLVCTTGVPYLTQGTARPLMIRIVDIHGKSDRLRVLRDLVWQADLCFTKPDMGMHLPWVLNVADSGALQLSRSYQITGVTV